MERRRELEEKVSWDFKCLDMDKNGRISLQSALFLFKTVHENRFSMKLWNSFLSSRCRPEDEVSFDEIRMFLCNTPSFDASGDDEYVRYHNQVRENQKERDYNLHQSLVAWQEDESAIVQKEKEKQSRTEKLKNNAAHLLDRLEEIGLPALLEDDDGYYGRTEERPIERVNATDLLDAFKNKYDSVREHVLLQMLKIQVGEGMWVALSSKEQNERLLHLKVEEEKLRKDDKLELASRFPGAKHGTGLSLLLLMDESHAEMEIRELKIKEKMKESGMDYEDVKEEFLKKLEFSEKNTLTTDQLLVALGQRLETEREILVEKLKGTGGFAILNPGERETLLAMLMIMHIRAMNELCFESAALAVGLTERLYRHSSETVDKDRKRQERLARRRLLLRKGRKIKAEVTIFKPVITRNKKVEGRIDVELKLVQNMERRMMVEREVFINMLQGRDATQHRVSAKKLGRDGRANHSLVLKTQWQGWRDRNTEDKMASLEQHRALLQEAVAIVFESRKEEAKLLTTNVDDLSIATQLLSELQRQQEMESRGLLNFSDKDKSDLVRMSRHEVRALEEEWFDNIAAIIFNIRDVSNEEEEVVKALNDKYDALRDQLMLEALKQQMSDAEWAVLSEQERQAKLTKLKLMERRLRKEGKYDEAAALLGDAVKNSDLLQSLMGESRERYQAKLQERLKNRKKRIQDGEDIDDDDEENELIDEDEAKSTGNILRDLQLRYEQEKEALLRRLQDGEGKFEDERERQAELMRLRLEKRKAEREGNFESAALVLGLAERNQASKEETLRKDRERQEQLARERLEARRNAKRKKAKMEEEPEPEKGNRAAWEESVMAELEKRHNQERNFFLDLMKDPDNADIREEAKEMSDDDRHKRISQLKEKRQGLDFEDSSDQEEHGAILEMATAVRMVVRQTALARKQGEDKTIDDIDIDDAIVSLIADLQQIQDKETKKMMTEIPDKTEEELAKVRTREINARKYEEVSNVAEVIFSYEGTGTDKEIVKALDKKYDALMDKLVLDALKNQLGAAEWAAMSEKERQAELLRRRLEQKRLMREGKLEEAAKLLGEGFAADANLKKLMGQNRAKYDEMMKERLARRRERLKQGLPVDEDEGDDELLAEFEADEGGEGKVDARTLLEDMQKRYEEEKDALMARLKGSDAQFLSEKQRQAELIRLKREQRMAQQEEKFGAAALVLGLAERNQANVESKLKADRARQEQLAKERLERMKAKRGAKKEKVELLTEGDEGALRDALIRHIEHRHSLEREELNKLLQFEDADLIARAKCMTSGSREERLNDLSDKLLDSIKTADTDNWMQTLKEMIIMKGINRAISMKSTNSVEPSKDDIIISIMADLQQRQDRESEQHINEMSEMEKDELIEQQKREIDANETARWPNIVITISAPEDTTNASSDQFEDAIESRYDAVKEKLIYEAVERSVGVEGWMDLSDEGAYAKMMEIKLKIENLKKEGKTEELDKLIAELFPDGLQLDVMLAATVEEQEKRAKDREELRESRRKTGMSEEEIAKIEKEEDDEFEEELKKRSKRNVLLDLEYDVQAEKDAVLRALRDSNAKLQSERERQVELARLKLELRRARRESNVESAALIVSLGKTQQAELERKFRSDRKRQEKLAKARLTERKNRRNQAKKTTVAQRELEDTNDSNKLQEAVLVEMDRKHTDERDLLLDILKNNASSKIYEMASKLDIISKQRRLDELKAMRAHWREGSPDELASTVEEQIQIFREAAALRLQLILAENTGNDSEEEKLKAASIAVLADLQESQDTETSYLMKDLSKKTVMTLKQLRKAQCLARNEKWCDNVASSLFGLKRQRGEDGTEELVDALDSKYSELKEKLFIELLKEKFGEEKWNAMSHKEQQEQISKLRAEEAQLMAGIEVKDSLLNDMNIRAMDSEESREKKEEKLRRRMERKKRARELGISEEELARQEGDDMDEEEDEKSVKTSDMLKELQNQYEAEKEALLAGLKGSEAKHAKEKERQLALIKLRRERERIKREDKFDSAAIIFNMAKEDQKNQEASYQAERARQEKLARDRIAAMRAKKRAKKMTYGEKVLEEIEKDIDNDVRIADQLEREGTIGYQNAVLDEMEKKHHSEREALVELLATVGADKDAADAASYLSDSQLKEKLSQLREERDAWKDNTMLEADAMPLEAEMTEEEKKQTADRLSNNWTTNQQLLTDGLVLRVEALKKELTAKGYPPEKLSEEVSIIMLADLQEKQKSETNAMCTVIADKTSDLLQRIKQEQRKARRESWHDNLASMILGVPAPLPSRRRSKSKRPDMSEISEDTEEMEEMLEEQESMELAALEKEMENEKEKRKLQGLSDDEMMKAMAELQQQQEAKRKAVQESIERQREANRRRLEERRRKRDEKQYEEDLALSIISSADKSFTALKEKSSQQKAKQQDSLEDRLRQRKEQRKRKAEEEARKQREEEEEEKRKINEEREEKKKALPPLPGGGLRREKTVVEQAGEMDDSEKKEIVGVLMREQTNLAKRLNREQTRQEEMVKFLRSKRRQKQEQREQEAAKIIGLGERQKTIVATQTKNERERQIQSVKERVKRIKYERTMTVKEPREEGVADGFKGLLEDDEADGLSEDEKMARIAQKMEMRFKQEGNQNIDQVMEEVDEEREDIDIAAGSHSGIKLDEKSKVQRLKDRYLQKKKLRKTKGGTSADNEEASEIQE